MLGRGVCLHRQGDFTHAIRVLERALALCRDCNHILQLPGITGFLGYVGALSRCSVESVQKMHEAIQGYEAIGLTSQHSLAIVRLAEGSLLAHRLEDAFAFATRAVALAHSQAQ